MENAFNIAEMTMCHVADNSYEVITSNMARFFEYIQRLFSKTGNNLGAKSGRLRRSGMVCGLADGAAGTNLVQIESAERIAARGCDGLLFASAIEFGCSAGNSVLEAA